MSWKQYLSRSAFLVILTFPNKQFLRVNSAFKYFDHELNSQTIDKFTTMFGVNVTLSCFKLLTLNSNNILELLIQTSFGESILFAVKGGVIFSYENALGSHSATVFGRPENVTTVL